MHIQDIKNKAVKLLSKKLSYQSWYRPQGYYQNPRELYESCANLGVIYEEIYPNHETKLQISEEYLNFLPDIMVYDNWVDPGNRVLRSVVNTYVCGIPQGRLFTNNQDLIAYISHDNYLIGDISYQWGRDKVIKPQNNSIFSYTYYKDPVKLKGMALSLLAGGHAGLNYSHWVADVLPRIHLVKKANLFDAIDWFIVPKFHYDYQKESFAALGIDARKVIVSDDPINHYQADMLLTTSFIRGQRSHLIPDWMPAFLRESFLPLAQQERNPFPKLIYVSRRDASYRFATNEHELVTLLSSYGFETFAMAEHDFKGKIQLFNGAKVIVALSGTSLTNLAFCEPGTYLIELTPDVFTAYVWLCYSNYAKVHHETLFCKSTAAFNEINWAKAERQDFFVNIPLLKSKLERIMTAIQAESLANRYVYRREYPSK